MNEFSAKKLGEVMAFAKVGNDTISKGFEGFRKLFTEVKLEDLKKENESHISAIESILEDQSLKDIMHKKVEGTSTKLSAMRDLYVKDEWDNPAELCEWLGFFEGAAVVHWTLVKGIAESLTNKPLEELADGAIIFHEELLKTSSLFLYNIGKEKSGDQNPNF
jgi:hypothetical protein